MARSRPPLPEGPWLVVGLARSGIAAATLLARRGERVFGVDSGRPDPDPREGLCALGVEVSLDDPGLDFLGRVSAVVKSPGVPATAPVVAAAREQGMPVLGELELGWRLLPNRFTAVTGTNGKTTVTEWIGHVIRSGGRRVEVAGNVGTPLSSLVDEVDPATEIVCECSSFQLEDADAFAPDVAVLLNLAPDHLDRHGSFGAYRDAKLRIFANQGPDDVAIYNGEDPAIDAGLFAGDGRRVPFTALDAPESPRPGRHNALNAAAVAAAARATGLGEDAIAAGIAGFPGVAHRLEAVGEHAGVIFVNDSKATNVAAALVALESFACGVRAILGGSLKGERFDALAPAVAAACSACYLIGEAAPLLAEDLAAAGVPLHDCGDLETAVARAVADAAPGETVLLSPACASFDQFRDYEQRGDRFRDLVNGLGR